jgi:hypothetical protein
LGESRQTGGSQRQGRKGIGRTGNYDAVTITQLIEIYGAEGAKFLWNTFDQQTIDDCIQETVEWRKTDKQREAEEIQEDHEKFVMENPEIVEDILTNEILELGFDPAKWERKGLIYADNTEAEAVRH